MFPLKYFLMQQVKLPFKLIIGKRKRPVGRPRKHVPAAEPASLVDYSSSDTDDDEPSEPPPSKKLVFSWTKEQGCGSCKTPWHTKCF